MMAHDTDRPRQFAVMSARIVLIALMLVVSSMPAMAEPPPPVAVQLSFLDPIQLFDGGRSVKGFRFSLFRGANRDLTGFDLSSMATVTDGSMRGLQISVANEVSGDVVGLQIGAFMNHVEGDLRGVQISAVTSFVSGGAGVQIAPLFADAEQLRGFQLGVITRAEELVGLQLGILNFNENGFLPVFPIFNFGR